MYHSAFEGLRNNLDLTESILGGSSDQYIRAAPTINIPPRIILDRY